MAEEIIPEEMAEPISQDIPEVGADVGRAPSVAMSDVEAGNTGVPVPPTTREELHSYNPVMQQLEFVANQMGRPMDDPEVLKEAAKINQQFTKYRQNQIPGMTVPQMQQQQVMQAPADMAVSAHNLPQQQSAQAGRASAGISDEGLNLIRKGYETSATGITETLAQEEHEAKRAAENSILNEEFQNKINEQYLNDIDAAEQERDRLAGDIQKISRQFLQNKIDPTRWYSSRSTGQKIAIGVAAFLSGFGGSDAVVNMVKDSIDRDIEAQKKQFEVHGKSIKNLWSMADKIYGQDMDKAKIVKAVMLENLKNKLDSNMAMAKTTAAKNKLMAAKGKLDIEIGKILEQAAQDRYKATQEVRKEQRLTSEEKKAEMKLAMADIGFNNALRAFKKGENTFRPLPGVDNDYTRGVEMVVAGLNYLLSGAAVTPSEAERARRFMATWKDSRQVQLNKLRDMQTLIRKYKKILAAETRTELRQSMGVSSNPKFKAHNMGN